MKAVYPPAQVAPYDSSSFGASPPATRWTRLATRAASGPAVTYVAVNVQVAELQFVKLVSCLKLTRGVHELLFEGPFEVVPYHRYVVVYWVESSEGLEHVPYP